MNVRWWTEPCLRIRCGRSEQQGRQGPEVIRGTGARLQPKNVPLFIYRYPSLLGRTELLRERKGSRRQLVSFGTSGRDGVTI